MDDIGHIYIHRYNVQQSETVNSIFVTAINDQPHPMTPGSNMPGDRVYLPSAPSDRKWSLSPDTRPEKVEVAFSGQARSSLLLHSGRLDI